MVSLQLFKCVPLGNPAHLSISLVEESGDLCPTCFSFLHTCVWLMVLTMSLDGSLCSSFVFSRESAAVSVAHSNPSRKPKPRLHPGLTSWLPPTTSRSLLSVVFRPAHGCSYMFAEGFSETIWHVQEVSEYLLSDYL